jgi:homogentisate 1,2-dioxygenase
MVDTFRPLELGEGGSAVDDGAYALSWSKGMARQAGAEGGGAGVHSEG